MSRRQAELSQAIRENSNLALQHAIASGEEAKAATRLARRSILLTCTAIVLAVLTSIWTIHDNRQLSNAMGSRLREEIRVLREISDQLRPAR